MKLGAVVCLTMSHKSYYSCLTSSKQRSSGEKEGNISTNDKNSTVYAITIGHRRQVCLIVFLCVAVIHLQLTIIQV